jgi:hypothetical protein
MHRRLLLQALTLAALAAAILAISAPAMGASPPSCAVSNTRTHKDYVSLQAATAAAKAGDTVELKGTCVGNTTVGKNIRIKGVTNHAFPGPPTLDGGNTGTVLQITNGTKTSIDGLTITNGVSLLNGVLQFGTTSISYVLIAGSIPPPSAGTEPFFFVGRACTGDPIAPATLPNEVALISRGTCFFSVKGVNAAAAGYVAAVIINLPGAGAFPQAVQLAGPVSIPVVGISDTDGAAMGTSGSLTWTNQFSFAQGSGAGGIGNQGTLALVDSVVAGNLAYAGGGLANSGSGVTTLAGSTTITQNKATFGPGIYGDATLAANGTNAYLDPITGATLPGWTGSVSGNFFSDCSPPIAGICGP